MISNRIREKLLNGNVEFMDHLDETSLDALAIEIKKSPLRETFLNNCFDTLAIKYPKYAFIMSSNLGKYNSYWQDYFSKDVSLLYDSEVLFPFMLSGEWANLLVLSNIEDIVFFGNDTLFTFIRYMNKTSDFRTFNKVMSLDDGNIKMMFIFEILVECSDLYFKLHFDIYDIILKSKDINEEYISMIAAVLLTRYGDVSNYLKLRDYIFANYSNNSLAAEIDYRMNNGVTVDGKNVAMSCFFSDINKLFITSKNYKFDLLNKYLDLIDVDIRTLFLNKLAPFMKIDSVMLEYIFRVGLGDKFLKYVDKYLALSTNAKVISDCGRGSCTRVFRIGDYVIKCSCKKWSLSNCVCPNSYLIAKNYEEDIVRNDLGEVTGALEVQRYLVRPLLEKEEDLGEAFLDSLEDEGYKLMDQPADDVFGANCRHLEDYRLADTDDFDKLPEWFKKDPVVLVDRDLVFPLEDLKPKIKAINISY